MRFTCADTEAHLVDVTDGRLDPSLEMRLHAHLEECARCRERAELWWNLVPRMRDLVPRPMAQLAARRLEVELLRRLQSEGAREVKARRGWRVVVAATALVGAAAALVIGLRPGRPTPAVDDGATLIQTSGVVTSRGLALTSSVRLASGSTLEVASGGQAELRMARGSMLNLRGPARLTLAGTARDVLLRLDEGTLQAQVAHRRPDETFTVAAHDLRVRVRGTRFIVETGVPGSMVSVQEGQVAVELANGSTRLLGAGEQVMTATTSTAAPSSPTTAPVAASPSPAAAGADAAAAGTTAPACLAAVRRCEGTARAVRLSMRAGGDHEALRLLSGATRLSREAAPGCARELSPCGDELGYLHAEALHASGRIDEAVVAYLALNRPTAPVAMRQNALYAAAELERQRGMTRAARQHYDSALAVAPRGALREEALIGSMESASEAGDQVQAARLARRYLSEFPTGHATASARRLLSAGPDSAPAAGHGTRGH